MLLPILFSSSILLSWHPRHRRHCYNTHYSLLFLEEGRQLAKLIDGSFCLVDRALDKTWNPTWAKSIDDNSLMLFHLSLIKNHEILAIVSHYRHLLCKMSEGCHWQTQNCSVFVSITFFIIVVFARINLNLVQECWRLCKGSSLKAMMLKYMTLYHINIINDLCLSLSAYPLWVSLRILPLFIHSRRQRMYMVRVTILALLFTLCQNHQH